MRGVRFVIPGEWLLSGEPVEINAGTRGDDPEIPDYLLDDQGQLIVDPADPDQRGALVVQMLRASREAERSGWFGEAAPCCDQ